MNTDNTVGFCVGVVAGTLMTCTVGYLYLKRKKTQNDPAAQHAAEHLKQAGEALDADSNTVPEEEGDEWIVSQ